MQVKKRAEDRAQAVKGSGGQSFEKGDGKQEPEDGEDDAMNVADGEEALGARQFSANKHFPCCSYFACIL